MMFVLLLSYNQLTGYAVCTDENWSHKTPTFVIVLVIEMHWIIWKIKTKTEINIRNAIETEYYNEQIPV